MIIPVVVTIVTNDISSSFDNPCAVNVTVSPASCNVTERAVVSGELVPVTCIPTAIPVVLAIVTVVDPAVVVPESETTAGAPQVLPTVIVCAAMAVPNPLKISSSPVRDSFKKL